MMITSRISSFMSLLRKCGIVYLPQRLGVTRIPCVRPLWGARPDDGERFLAAFAPVPVHQVVAEERSKRLSAERAVGDCGQGFGRGVHSSARWTPAKSAVRLKSSISAEIAIRSRAVRTIP